MANLNFQQPPRSIANAALTGRTTGGFGGSSMSGHVTPTSGMFQTADFATSYPGATNYGQQTQQPQQLSPNRNAQLSVGGPALSSGNRTSNLFGQRPFVERRAMQGLGSGPMSNMGNFMQSGRGGYGTGGGGGGGGPLNNFHVFGGGGNGADASTPALLDPTEFPSLTNARGQNDQTLPQSNPLQPPGSKPYGNFFTSFGMVKQPTSEQSEFTMSNEDFPALPGTQNSDGTTNAIGSSSGGIGNAAGGGGIGGSGIAENNLDGTEKTMNSIVVSGGGSSAASAVVGGNGLGAVGSGLGGVVVGGGGGGSSGASGVGSATHVGLVGSGGGGGGVNSVTGQNAMMGVGGGLGSGAGGDHMNDNSSNDKLVKSGVQTSPDGKVTNIPASMVNNQFGMVGLLTFIRAAETDPNLVTLSLGTDLTGLGLNLNSQESLHPTFAGPFVEQPCRAQDVEYNVPPEYLINFAIRDKLTAPALKVLQEDLLFFLFYTNIGDKMQLMAASELHSREWRYHVEEKIWITRIPGINQYEKNGTKERGTFYYFDAQSWKRLSKVFQIDAEKLDKCPNVSAFMNGKSV
ncbi:regulator of gene activity isoform X1 [Drosophila sulfurigaster albostrigata]|uniref:regulator of gene activity isoform X1 n=1 Tax=Drosophila sulfurigaster albostrigata TaxID=89887 RepID=UPI002D21E874|nr:regulator of gene activity isoform X1 [Drosophila sulfurigaster albostrigata]